MSLHLILGPVFSGKTTELIREGRRYASIKWSVILIKPNASDSQTTHTQYEWKDTLRVNALKEATPRIIKTHKQGQSQMVLLDDAHFFKEDDWEVVQDWIETKGVIVRAAGLDSDSQGALYTNLLSQIPRAETIQKLTALVRIDTSSRFEEGTLSQEGSHSVDEERGMLLQMSPVSEQTRETFLNRPNERAHFLPGRTKGELTLILGPMFAGKTTELLRQATRYFHAGAHILLINHEWNVRYGTVEICSHDGTQASPHHGQWNSPRVHFMRTAHLKTIPMGSGTWGKIDAIFVEEGQFFQDVEEVIPQWLIEGKQVYISGLDGDAERKPFGGMCWLVPWAKQVRKQCALCHLCGDGTEAPFTRRLTAPSQEGTPVDVGAGDKYEAVCRRHWS